jgi:hypothetical protein
MANAVAKKKKTDVSTDVMDDILGMAGEGASFDSSEMQIPFVRVLQALSPQLNKKKAEYIDGAEQGDLFNNVTMQSWDGEDGVNIIPCFQTTKYLEFTPRDMGGGFRGELAANDPAISQTTRVGSKELLSNGNELVKSDQHYCLIVEDDGSFQPAVVDMKSTQLKVSRRWKTQIAMQKVKRPDGSVVIPPVFATIWKLSTVEESNDQGTWNNYQIEKVRLVDSRDLLMEAKAFRDSIRAGEVKAMSEEGAGGTSAPIKDDDIPF